MEFKPWYRLLDYWCHKKGRYGLTIPFMVGAIKAKDIEEIFNEIRFGDDQRPYPVVLNFCKEIDEYVLSMPSAPKKYFDDCKAFERLCIDDDKLENLDTFEQLLVFMNAKYDKYIKAGTYSKDNNGSWNGFSPTDISDIAKADRSKL